MFHFQNTMFAHEFTTPKARNTSIFEETDTYLTSISSSGEGLVTWGEPVEEVEEGEETIFFGQHEDSNGKVEKNSSFSLTNNKKKHLRVASIQKKLRKSVVRMKRTLRKFAATSGGSTSNSSTSTSIGNSSSSHSIMSDKPDSPMMEDFRSFEDGFVSFQGSSSSNSSFSPTHCWSMSQNPSSNFSFSEYANPEDSDEDRVGRSVFRPSPLDLTATLSSSTYLSSSSEKRHEEKKTTATCSSLSTAVTPKRVLRRPTFDISTPRALLARPTFETSTRNAMVTQEPTPMENILPVTASREDKEPSMMHAPHDRMISWLRRTKPSCNTDEGDDQPPTPNTTTMSSMQRLSSHPVLSDDSFGIPKEDQSHDDDDDSSGDDLVDSRRQLRLRMLRQNCVHTWQRATHNIPRWSSRLVHATVGQNKTNQSMMSQRNQKEYEGACDDASQYYRQCPERTLQTMPLLF